MRALFSIRRVENTSTLPHQAFNTNTKRCGEEGMMVFLEAHLQFHKVPYLALCNAFSNLPLKAFDIIELSLCETYNNTSMCQRGNVASNNTLGYVIIKFFLNVGTYCLTLDIMTS